jgi:hypothetical protein
MFQGKPMKAKKRKGIPHKLTPIGKESKIILVRLISFWKSSIKLRPRITKKKRKTS